MSTHLAARRDRVTPCGPHPHTAVVGVKAGVPWWGFDARTGQTVDLWLAGIMGPLPVLASALQVAVSGAVMTLGSDVLVHHRTPLQVVRL